MIRLIFTIPLVVSACSAPPRESREEARDWPARVTPPPASTETAEGTPAPGDLEAHVRLALEHNPELRAAYLAFEAAGERIEQASTLPDPRFTWIEFVEELQTRTGPHPRRLMLSQTFPWPGVLDLRGEAAEHRAEVLWHRAVGRALAVRREVEEVWYELGWLAHAERVNGEALALLAQLEPVVQRRIESGGLQEDLLRLQMEIAKVEERLVELADRRGPLHARLDASLGTMSAAEPKLAEPALPMRSFEDLAEIALDHSPALASLAEDVRSLRAERELADRRRYPDLTFGVDYLQVDSAVMDTPGSGDDPLAARLSLNLPIWTSSYAAAEREAAHALRAGQLTLDDARNRLEAEVRTVLFRLDDAARNLALYRDSLLPRARETHELTLTSYRSGAASVLDLIDSERLTLEFELQYWNACRDVRQQEARLRALVGGSLER